MKNLKFQEAKEHAKKTSIRTYAIVKNESGTAVIQEIFTNIRDAQRALKDSTPYNEYFLVEIVPDHVGGI